MEKLKIWYLQLQTREQRMLAAGAAALVLLLFYALVWSPTMTRQQALRETVKEQQATAQWMQQAAREVAQLRAGRPNVGKISPGQSLLALVDQSAKNSRLGPAMKRVEPEGQTGVRVWFEQANFDDLVLWLEALQRDYGVHIATLVVERQETPGQVNARVGLAEEGT